MTSGVLKVTYAALESLSSDCTNALHQLTDEIGTLRSQVNGLVAGGWLGQAATAFTDTEKRWEVSAQDLAEILTQISTALNRSLESYQQTERANTALFSG